MTSAATVAASRPPCAPYRGELHVAGVDTDRLYPLRL